MSSDSDRPQEGLEAAVEPGRIVSLGPGLIRITQNNPGLFSGPGTNTFVIGDDEVMVLEPGEMRDDGHLERIVEAVAGRPVRGVLPSHGHPDHWPLAQPLARELDAPLLYFDGDHHTMAVDEVLDDRDRLRLGASAIDVLHTPGHAADHVALHWRERRLLFPGDHVMGWSTTIIAPPEGDLETYLGSLRRLLDLQDLLALLPAHGPTVTEPYARMTELLQHRQERTDAALRALDEGSAQLMDLVARIYADVDPKLHPAAARSLWAHLLSLESAGRLARDPEPRSEAERFDFEHAAGSVWRLA